MKQNSNIFVLLGFLILVAVSGCSTNDDIVPEKPNEITLNGKKLTIKISEESFSAEQRTTRAADVIKTDTIDMGNGIIAERTILPDTTTAQESAVTRAAMAEGHYTIFALDASGTRMPDELSGTVQAGQFVPDQNKSISLAPGTYTFVCFNDAVTDKGTGLAIEGEDCVNPMIGVTTKAVSGDLDEVSFQMIHYSARFRTEITSYTAYVDVDQTENDFYDDSALYTDILMNLKGGNPTRGGVFHFLHSNATFSRVGNQEFSSIVKPFKVQSGYWYIPVAPGENFQTHYISYQPNVRVYGKNFYAFPGQFGLVNNVTTPQLLPNKSYLIKLTFKTKDPLYLYQDGTVGYIGDKGTRTPIALVVKEKTTTENGMAVALKNGEFRGVPGFQYYNMGIGGDDGTVNNMQGYDLTYTTNYYSSTFNGDRTIAPAYNAGYGGATPTAIGSTSNNAYYIAAHYNPGVTITGANIGKWFLASSGQWKLFLSKWGGLDASKVTTFSGSGSGPAAPGFGENGTIPWDGTKMATYFTQVGGEFPFGEYTLSGTDQSSQVAGLYVGLSATKAAWGYDIFVTNYMSGYIRPFVYF